MADHRLEYTPERLYLNGSRMMHDYTVDDAVADYLELHPDADRDQVRAEIEHAAA